MFKSNLNTKTLTPKTLAPNRNNSSNNLIILKDMTEGNISTNFYLRKKRFWVKKYQCFRDFGVKK